MGFPDEAKWMYLTGFLYSACWTEDSWVQKQLKLILSIVSVVSIDQANFKRICHYGECSEVWKILRPTLYIVLSLHQTQKFWFGTVKARWVLNV